VLLCAAYNKKTTNMGQPFAINDANAANCGKEPSLPRFRTKAKICYRVKKTFNNHLGFERGLWKHQTKAFADVSKGRVFGTGLQIAASFTTPSLANGPPDGRPVAGRTQV
jgi:hypothetical protein